MSVLYILATLNQITKALVMNNKYYFKKIVGLMLLSSTLFGPLAEAKQEAASHNIGFFGTVGLRCSADSQEAVGYAKTIASGANAKHNGSAIQLDASDTIAFDCNSNSVDLTVVTINVSGHDFNNHLVNVDTSTVGTLATNVPAITSNVTIIDPYTSGNNVLTDANGDIAVTVTSSFFIAKTPLPTSIYSADFLVSVTAQ